MWNVPEFSLMYISPTLGGLTSYLSILLLLIYMVFFVDNYRKPLLAFIFLGITYYTIASLQFVTSFAVQNYLVYFIKFIIVVVCSTEVAKDSKIEELFIVTIFGTLSIILHATVFPDIDVRFGTGYGRFSGFYINPNFAAITALIGFSMSFGIKNTKLKLIGQLVFSFAGILTMSRYFILIWVFINIVAAVMSRKNLIAPIIGIILIVFVLLSGAIKLNKGRFEAWQSVFNDEQVNTEKFKEDGKSDTWALYTDAILDKPFFGNGYRSLQKNGVVRGPGVHNAYLLVLGEAGIIAFAFLLWITLFLLIKSIQYYQYNFYYIFLTIAILTSFLVGHTYFEKYSTIFISIFLYLKLYEHDMENKQSLE